MWILSCFSGLITRFLVHEWGKKTTCGGSLVVSRWFCLSALRQQNSDCTITGISKLYLEIMRWRDWKWKCSAFRSVGASDWQLHIIFGKNVKISSHSGSDASRANAFWRRVKQRFQFCHSVSVSFQKELIYNISKPRRARIFATRDNHICECYHNFWTKLENFQSQ